MLSACDDDDDDDDDKYCLYLHMDYILTDQDSQYNSKSHEILIRILHFFLNAFVNIIMDHSVPTETQLSYRYIFLLSKMSVVFRFSGLLIYSKNFGLI